MILIILVAVIIGFGLILLIKGETPTLPYHSPHQPLPPLGHLPGAVIESPHASLNPPITPAVTEISLEQLATFCRRLLLRHGLTILSVDMQDDTEFHVLAQFEHPLLRGNVILCGTLVRASGVVDSSQVIGFSDMVKAERALKGIFVTNGYFSQEVMKLNEGASMELIDAAQLRHLMATL